MTTEAQTEANRVNAQKSTGPRTPEGKEKAAQNALKHGLFARETVIRGEDEGDFEVHREMLLGQLIADTPLEEMLAERIVDLSWRLKRAVRDQEKAFVKLYERQMARAEEPGNAALPSGNREQANQEIGDPETIGRMILEDFSQEGVLDRLLRYERRIESSLYRTLNQLRRVHDQVQKAALEDTSILERWREEDWETKKGRAFARCSSPAVSPGPAGPTTNTPAPGAAVVQTKPISGPAGRDGAWGTRDEGANAQNEPNPGGAGWGEAGGARGESETCETNPICAGSGEEVGRGRPTYEEPSAGGTTNLAVAQDQSCETNPICGGVNNRQRGYTPIFRRRR